MLKKRIYTAVCLVAVLLLILWSQNDWLFKLFLLAFFCAASWENARLFGNRHPVAVAAVSGLVFVGVSFWLTEQMCFWLALASVLIWVLFLIPSMFRDLYFAGRAFGKHKLAPSISPGKTWEGAIGGVIAVLLVVTAVFYFTSWHMTLASKIHAKYGWIAVICALVVLVALSILGDLLESKLKRRAGVKDSSQLLPGHGGVLDRFDSLIPVLPLALLLGMWLSNHGSVSATYHRAGFHGVYRCFHAGCFVTASGAVCRLRIDGQPARGCTVSAMRAFSA